MVDDAEINARVILFFMCERGAGTNVKHLVEMEKYTNNIIKEMHTQKTFRFPKDLENHLARR